MWTSQRSLHLQSQDPIWALIQDLVLPFLIQFSANEPGKAMHNGTTSWAPPLTRETWKKILVPGFGLTQSQPSWPFGE